MIGHKLYLVVFNLTIGSETCGCQTAGAAEAEPCKRGSRIEPRGQCDGHYVFTGQQLITCQHLLASIGPVAVRIQVDPRVEIPVGRRNDLDLSIATNQQTSVENYAVIQGIAGGVGILTGVRFVADTTAQIETGHNDVTGAVVLESRGIGRIRGVTKVDTRQVDHEVRGAVGPIRL